jgi:hypothetical protein
MDVAANSLESPTVIVLVVILIGSSSILGGTSSNTWHAHSLFLQISSFFFVGVSNTMTHILITIITILITTI